MFSFRRWILAAILCLAALANAEEIHVTILHVNDLYEMSPVAGGKLGGVARFATLRARLLRQNRNTYTVLAGDALSPSVLGTAVVNGRPVAGAQMVAALNSVGLDFATFGNHEFDLTEDQLQSRIRESRFLWFSGNVRSSSGEPFPGVRQNVVFTVEGQEGHVRIGLVGLTLDENKKPWVRYNDIFQTAREQVNNLRSQGVDVVIAVTHLNLEQDEALAAQVPGIDMILGGHDHEHTKVEHGPNSTPIFKADSNLRSVYVHDLVYDTEKHTLRIDSRLMPVDDTIPEDETVAEVVKTWAGRALDSFRKLGFDPGAVIATSPETLEGKSRAVCNHPTNLTGAIASAFLHAFPQSEAAIFNAGSIRIDDDIPAGPIRQYDVLRILPFGGNVVLAEMKGLLLARVLDAGQSNQGTGGYLQAANIDRSQQGAWQINGQPIDPAHTYRVAMPAYLLTGNEKNMAFLTRTSAGLGKVTDGPDMRFSVIKELQKKWSK